jgi:hypothetical protein
MLKQLTNDILENAIHSVLSGNPQGAMDVKKAVVALLSSEYDTNLTTSSGQDKLYISIKDRLRKWNSQGVHCLDLGGSKYVKIDAQVVETPVAQPKAPKTPKAPKAPKIVVEDIPVIETSEAELKEIENLVEASAELETLEIVETKPKQKTTPPQKKDDSYMQIIESQKQIWIDRLKEEGKVISETPFDLSCPSLRQLAIASQECYGTFKASDDECKLCPLAQWCKDSKEVKNTNISVLHTYVSATPQPTVSKVKLNAPAKEAKPKAKTFTAPQSLIDAVAKNGKQPIDLSSDLTCPLTKDNLKAGTKGWYVHGVGIVSPRCFETETESEQG